MYRIQDAPSSAKALHRNLSRSAHGPGGVYLWKPLLHLILPLRRVLLIDSDVALFQGANELWGEFDRFGPGASIGIARELAPTYRALGRRSGLNGGVQLMDLEQMRTGGGLYERELRRCAEGGCGRIGYLGDQTLYTYMHVREPRLFHVLSCGWNRQLSTHYASDPDFLEWFTCVDKCRVVHANQPALKGLAFGVQTKGRAPTCAECTSVVGPRVGGRKALAPQRMEPLGLSKRMFLDCCCGLS